MNPVQTVFPKTAANIAQLKEHGVDAAHAAREAYRAPDTPTRLDALVNTYDAFDHAARDAQKLPLDRVWPGVGTVEKGYNISRVAVTALVASGVVPGARERMGKQELFAAQDHLHEGLATARDNQSRYGRARANDWLSHSIEDAATGLLYVRRPDVALPLMRGLASARSAVSSKQEFPAADVQKLDDLFASARGSLDQVIAAAQAAPAPVDPKVQSGADTAAQAAAAESVQVADQAAHDLAQIG